jgi:type IV fimbrial biogenesis protein FimT
MDHQHISQHRSLGPYQRLKGFTLVELMITLAVAFIIAAVAAPAFKNIVLSQRIKTASFDVNAALTLTRSEAVKRNTSVTMQATDGDWAKGWSISADGTTIRVQTAYRSVAIVDSAGLGAVTFSGNGRLSSAATDFTISSTEVVEGVPPRCISISLSGRASSHSGSCADA